LEIDPVGKPVLHLLWNERGPSPFELFCSLSVMDGKYGVETTSKTESSSKVLNGDFA
jgi:hypothetical protein